MDHVNYGCYFNGGEMMAIYVSSQGTMRCVMHRIVDVFYTIIFIFKIIFMFPIMSLVYRYSSNNSQNCWKNEIESHSSYIIRNKAQCYQISYSYNQLPQPQVLKLNTTHLHFLISFCKKQVKLILQLIKKCYRVFYKILLS